MTATPPPPSRVVSTLGALCALAAAAAFLAAGFAEGGALRVTPATERLLLAAQSLLLIPTAVVLWRWTAGFACAAAGVATGAGVGSLLLWGTAPYGGHWQLEPWWLLLSGIWWVGIGLALRQRRRGLGIFTMVLGVFALTDAVVTALEDRIPFWTFAAFGGPKIPLSLVWMVWVGIVLLIASPRREHAPVAPPSPS